MNKLLKHIFNWIIIWIQRRGWRSRRRDFGSLSADEEKMIFPLFSDDNELLGFCQAAGFLRWPPASCHVTGSSKRPLGGVPVCGTFIRPTHGTHAAEENFPWLLWNRCLSQRKPISRVCAPHKKSKFVTADLPQRKMWCIVSIFFGYSAAPIKWLGGKI